MKDEDRGKIRNREFAKQLRNFSGLRFGKITPTDIDGFIDFGGRIFIFIESKHGTAKLPYGQRLALERLCDASQKAGIDSIVIIGSHETQDDIDMANIPVIELRWMGKWRIPKKKTTVRQKIDNFLKWVDS
jgi:glycerophosphoryl diester phosphodiesterase